MRTIGAWMTSRWNLLPHSLALKVLRSTFIGTLILGIVTLIIGLGLYTWSLVQQYSAESFMLARSVASSIDNAVYEEKICERVLAIYQGLSEKELEQINTDAYRAHFKEIYDSADYKTIQSIMLMLKDQTKVNDIYFGIYDREAHVFLTVCDCDDSSIVGCYPGYVEEIDDKTLNKYLKRSDTGRLYDIAYHSRYGWLCTSGVPLYHDVTGDILGYVMCDISIADIWLGIRMFLLQFSLGLFLSFIIVSFFIMRRIKRYLVEPINQITQAAGNYVKDRREGIAESHFSNLNIYSGDEIENLSHVMAEMEHDLNIYEAELTRSASERERIRTELDLARKIQADALPSVFPPFPERHDIEIYASMTPAKEVGGDFYDFFLINHDLLGIVMADVSGKGVPAALLMMVTKMLVQNYTMTGITPDKVLEAVNHQICLQNKEEMFVTVWVGILDLKKGQLTASNAGHEYPIIKKAGEKYQIYRDKHGFVIGGLSSVKYTSYTVDLEPGSQIFLYTDGVPEATDLHGSMFGEDRMLAVLQENNDSPENIVKHMHHAVDAFVGDASQFDDMTMLCLEYKGSDYLRGECAS